MLDKQYQYLLCAGISNPAGCEAVCQFDCTVRGGNLLSRKEESDPQLLNNNTSHKKDLQVATSVGVKFNAQAKVDRKFFAASVRIREAEFRNFPTHDKSKSSIRLSHISRESSTHK